MRGPAEAETDLDRRRLRRDLTRAIEGDVRFDTKHRALYAHDASNYRQVPIGVVFPRTLNDVVATHEVCSAHGAPIVARGAGTSLSGETVNVAVVIDCSRHLTWIGDAEESHRLIRAQPGAINEHVNERAGKAGLVFGPDPSTHAYCTIGGNIGNNSCGMHSVQAAFEGDGARTSDNVHELEVLTYRGARLRVGRDRIDGPGAAQIRARLEALRDRYKSSIRERFVQIPRRVSGYNLDELLPENGFHVARALAGTEGTCVTVLEATLQLIPKHDAHSLLVLGYHDHFAAADAVPAVLECGPLTGLEGFDRKFVTEQRAEGLNSGALSLLPDGSGWLLAEFGAATGAEAHLRAEQALASLKGGAAPIAHVIHDGSDHQRELAEVREVGLASASFPPGGRDRWTGWEDAAVPPERLGEYLRALDTLLQRYEYTTSLYGHFGQGCVHTRIDFELRTADGRKSFRSFLEDAADLVVSLGGSLSGEHGDGQALAELLPRMYGDELVEAFREFKAIWDPDWKMNPGKIVRPNALDDDLKLAVPLRAQKTAFAFPHDGGDFRHAVTRCVGVGRCRKPGGDGVMCPSYVVTREEEHTTRGRARLLYELLAGEVVESGWRSREVEEALDLCLSCKGCTNDCPADVDMPTYKAEFLHHRYARRLRPRHAYALGLIDKVARVVSFEPEAFNFLAATPPFAQGLKLAAGITQRRPFPRFAPLTFRQWFERRPPHRGGRRVVLWPDTFTSSFHPEVGVAAVEVLERAGFEVVLPSGYVCCGRPLYDYGMLDLARRYLRRCLDSLAPEIANGTPIVGLEPSCMAVFKDELPKLLPDDARAQRVAASTHHFAEFLRTQAAHADRRVHGHALLWGHCHQKATGGIDADRAVLEESGFDVNVVSGGCCGLAGSWGFESGHYDVSVACGEHALLPAVRAAGYETAVVADGFSCRTQIEQLTGHKAVHLAQALVPDAARPSPSLARRAARAALLVAPVAAAAAPVAAAALRR
jgi:FAD/FMN-containing dehydrogenase/Fe-S oxidoreductase